ncbi:MAG: helix-turn-helix domain-containing protein, partial [Deltaproteobacteria bacterium]|nr:helix-turn-helix domain-containing protein [Deltaproteobacteria bacterium]
MTDKHQPHPYELLSLEDIGTLLREAREREGLTKTDVSSRTKITMEQLNTIEDGRPPKIASVYARGFLRTYSELVHLENADVVYEAYKHLTSRNDDDFDKPLTSKYMDNKLLAENPSNTLNIVIVVLVILVLGLIGLYVSPSFRAKAYSVMPDALRAKLPAFEQAAPPATEEA